MVRTLAEINNKLNLLMSRPPIERIAKPFFMPRLTNCLCGHGPFITKYPLDEWPIRIECSNCDLKLRSNNELVARETWNERMGKKTSK